ncbi:MAG: hypothetical protein HRU19_03020 [Pseudobacteriovorax sp.]|nr:hypothetical protein [Pseudobacteriovorax sp.]
MGKSYIDFKTKYVALHDYDILVVFALLSSELEAQGFEEASKYLKSVVCLGSGIVVSKEDSKPIDLSKVLKDSSIPQFLELIRVLLKKIDAPGEEISLKELKSEFDMLNVISGDSYERERVKNAICKLSSELFELDLI